MPAFARPVRTAAKLWFTTSSDFFILSSVSWTICFEFIGLPLHAHGRADLLTGHGAPDIAVLQKVEHDDRKLVVHAQRDRGRVHHFQALFQYVDVPDLFEALGVLYLVRVVR